MDKVSIILGLQFGDEGKGATVSYLAKQSPKSLIIRFNGGHQVGHTVVFSDEHRHIFSNFGSGSFQGAHTYWSEYCTVNPIGVYKESLVLNNIGVNPVNIYNSNAMVTTPFDIFKNHKLEKVNNHGSVGVGFGTTIQRNEDYFHLYVRDLLFPKIRDAKLKLIQDNYYNYNYDNIEVNLNFKLKKAVDDFIIACDNLVKNYIIVENLDILISSKKYDNYIFEGGQGILLDQNYGFFPNVTRSNTTSKNALEIIKNSILKDIFNIQTYYITRAYQTRHGNGFMTNEELDNSYIINNPLETNVNGGFQGDFRKSVLDIELLKYAFCCDCHHNMYSNKNIVVTCLDQVPPHFPVTVNNQLIDIIADEIPNLMYATSLKLYKTFSDKGILE
jgi:adenylosuccinate synthase